MLTELSMSQGLLVSLLGMAIVFVALLAIIAIIKLISVLAGAVVKANRGNASQTEPILIVNADSAADGRVPAAGSMGEVALYDTDEQTAAMIMAIVADDLKAPLNELRFISIRQKA
ncbi:MAG: OadG family protein [Oscillospiraceae bacterium]|jgi:Na+-transporting methylmalonyl-CoA/oxaloacetate decarboxylase gamma subunit|nr:OadG family protein [Oscillospiraceae bacterium]